MSCNLFTVNLQSKEKGAVRGCRPAPQSEISLSEYISFSDLSICFMGIPRLSIPANQNSHKKQWLWCPHSNHDLDENLKGKGEEAYCLPTELTRRLKQYVLQPRKCNGGLGFGIPRRLKSRKDNLVHGHCLHLVSDFLQDYSIPVSRKVERGKAII